MTERLVITAVRCMTAVGLDATATAAATRAGVSRLRASEQFVDTLGNPIIEASIPWLPAEEEPDEGDDDAVAAADGDDGSGEDDAGDDPEFEDDGEDEEDESLDPYEMARQADDLYRVGQAARRCVVDLVDASLASRPAAGHASGMMLGVAGAWRPGPRFEGSAHETANDLLSSVRRHVPNADLTIVPTGNAAAIHGLALAANRIAKDPTAVCLVGGMDSLLDGGTLEWYESAGRLKSESPGRNQGLPPAEGVGFVLVETALSAARGGRLVMAEVLGLGLSSEPNPFLSERPSRAEGLTVACRTALAASRIAPSDIGAVLTDMDGEFHRAKEWALAQARCFGRGAAPPLLHPANCFGAMGAASAAVLMGVAAVGLAGGRFKKPVLVVCSDDAGECGAAVLAPPPKLPRH